MGADDEGTEGESTKGKEGEQPAAEKPKLPKELQDKVDLESVRQAKLNNEKLAADVAKAEAAARQAVADAAKAEAETRKLEAEATEHSSGAERAARDAEARKKAAVATKDAAEARVAQATSWIPDFSKVPVASAEFAEGPVASGVALATRATQYAAAVAAKTLQPALPSGAVVLLTSDIDLATDDAIYSEVKSGLDTLLARASEAEKALEGGSVQIRAFGAVLPVLAAAVPQLMSLLSTKTKVNVATVTPDDLMAVSTVAGVLKTTAEPGTTVMHDDFRLVPSDGVYLKVTELETKRSELSTKRLNIQTEKVDADQDVDTHTASLAAAKKKLEAAGDDDEKKATAEQEIRAAEEELKKASALSELASSRIELIDGVTNAMDTFSALIHKAPDGGGRPPLATAALQERLHGETPSITHVLFIKSGGGQVQQAVSERLLRFRAHFTSWADSHVNYMLLATKGNSIAASGTATARAAGQGKVGDPFKIVVDEVTALPGTPLPNVPAVSWTGTPPPPPPPPPR